MNRSTILHHSLPAIAIVGAACAGATSGAAQEFTSVHPELFDEKGSLSNAWADFDRDGDLDFAVTTKSGAIRLYRNDGGLFTSVGEAMGLPTEGPEYRGISWGDYDGDGWLDLYAGATRPEASSALFRSKGGAVFTDVAEEAGLTFPGRSSRQNNWIDYDGDGDLDLFATNRIGPNRLYRNDGGRFAHVLPDAPMSQFKSTVGACWLDYDEDGDLDLFLANQSGQTDSLVRNDRGTFVDVAPELGMDMAGREKSEGGVGCAVGDYDNDGHLDIFVASYGRNLLWRNNGDGSFANMAAAMGVDVENHAVGATWGDFDNDGLIDLFITSYTGARDEQVPADALFRNRGTSGFSDVIGQYPLLNNGDHGVEWVDHDADGAIDLSLTHGYTDVGGHFVYRNRLSPADAARGLNIEVRGPDGSPAMPGTEVRLYDAGGEILATRQLSTGGGYNAQSVTPVHFGLASSGPVMIEVTYVTGTSRRRFQIADVDPAQWSGRVLVFTPPADNAEIKPR
ncbi:CRTAC1 family protein [Croceicoccus mobilis]|uniref:ASPIC/UnbV domain-containing protein n=1 Tax=Croceicoccus mobilis TaxID=1703339 RepID=A0A916YXL8_9SPHN|nr:CRTAC1 family protein [Croceicoccus mobilis]GGD65835.1 hypothetical protein GCM10010990_14150 [Croceicoccus mobilis]